MTGKLFIAITLVTSGAGLVPAQTQPVHPASVPIYTVTVVDRTVSAVDYQYRNGPTMIDFRGTVLLPQAAGGAIVDSKEGRTEIDAHFERLLAPTRYGPEYLTYVLWAITPDGHAHNLGEVLAGSSDKAKLRVTTGLQAFGMIVTAEPYGAVRQPAMWWCWRTSRARTPSAIGNLFRLSMSYSPAATILTTCKKALRRRKPAARVCRWTGINRW